MNHIRIVANGFRALGIALAIPALAFLITFGTSLFSLAHPPTFQPSHPLDVGRYGLVGLLQNGMIGIAGMFQFLGIIGFWAAVALTIVSICVLLLALILFFAGRGIAAHGRRARIVGIAICVLALFLDWSLLFSVPRGVGAALLLLMAAVLYSIWILGWRYHVSRH